MWYQQKNQNRKVTWMLDFGSVQVNTLFAAKTYQLVVSVVQATILDLFNQGEVFTVAEIKERTNITDEYFKPAMMRFCEPKVKLLKKEINKPVFKEEEKIQVNTKFTSQTIKSVLIPKKSKVVSKEEVKEIDKAVLRQRQFVIQANIVKVMKTEKELKFPQLIAQTVRNIGLFKPDPKMIKEQVEVLIRDEYMKRDETDKSKLIYLP